MHREQSIEIALSRAQLQAENSGDIVQQQSLATLFNIYNGLIALDAVDSLRKEKIAQQLEQQSSTPLYYYPESRTVFIDADLVTLSKRENQLFHYLAQRPFVPTSADVLREETIGNRYDNSAVYLYMSRLRRKLEPGATANDSKYIVKHNQLYIFTAPVVFSTEQPE